MSIYIYIFVIFSCMFDLFFHNVWYCVRTYLLYGTAYTLALLRVADIMMSEDARWEIMYGSFMKYIYI